MTHTGHMLYQSQKLFEITTTGLSWVQGLSVTSRKVYVPERLRWVVRHWPALGVPLYRQRPQPRPVRNKRTS